MARNYTDACYNLADLFEDSDAFSFGADNNKTTCDFSDPDCDNEWQASFPGNWNATGNYSSVAWKLAAGGAPSEEGYEPKNVTVRLYSGEGCLENDQEVRYFQWGGCEEPPAEDCVSLPWSASSFRVLQTPLEEEGYGCLKGAERGTERSAVRGDDGSDSRDGDDSGDTTSGGARGCSLQLTGLLAGLVGAFVLLLGQ